MEFSLLISGIWFLKCCILLPTNLRNPKIKCRETCCMTRHPEITPTAKFRLRLSTTILNYATSIVFLQTRSLLNLVRCSTFLKIVKRWARWSSRAEVQHWDACPEPTDLRLIGHLTQSIWTQRSTSNMLTPKTNSQTYWQREISHVINGIIFSICSISAFSAVPARKRMQQGTGEERIVAKWKPTLNLVSQAVASSSTAPSSSASNRPGILKASSQGSNHIGSAGKPAAGGSNCNDAASTSQVWLSDAKTQDSARRLVCCRNEPGSEFSRRCKETCRRKFRRRRLGVAEQLPHISCLRSTPRESLLESAIPTRTQFKRQNGRPRCEYVDMGSVYDCHSASRRSSWKRLFGESTFYRKSGRTSSETIVRCDKEVCQGSVRNPRHIRDRLVTKFLEKNDFVNWPSSSVINSKNLRFLRLSIVHGQNQWKSQKRTEGSKCREMDGIVGSRWSSSGKISQDSLNCRFSPRSRTWWLK